MVMIRAESEKKGKTSSYQKKPIITKENNDNQAVKKRLKSMSLYTTKYKPIDTSEKKLCNQEVYDISKQLVKFGLERGYY